MVGTVWCCHITEYLWVHVLGLVSSAGLMQQQALRYKDELAAEAGDARTQVENAEDRESRGLRVSSYRGVRARFSETESIGRLIALCGISKCI